MDQQTVDFMQAIAKAATSESEKRFAEIVALLIAKSEEQTARLVAAIASPRPLKGQSVYAFNDYAANALSNYALDCAGFNAVHAAVFTGGSSISATLSLEGADAEGGNYQQLPDPASSVGVTADTSFIVIASTRWVKARLASRTGGTFTVLLTPCIVPSQPLLEAAPSQGTYTNRSGTITSGGTAQTLAAANPNRKFLFVQNVSSETLWINFTTTAVQSQPSIKLLPNADFCPQTHVSTELVSIIGATTGSAFVAKEA